MYTDPVAASSGNPEQDPGFPMSSKDLGMAPPPDGFSHERRLDWVFWLLDNTPFHLFELCPDRDDKGKRPAHNGGAWTATRDRQILTYAFTQNPFANIGIAYWMGGHTVLDIDVKDAINNGIDSLKLLEAEHGPLPPTLTFRTPSGGLHYVFKDPEGVLRRNTAGKLGLGIDTRGEGGYGLAPGSTIGGKPYEILSPGPITELPAWVATVRGPAVEAREAGGEFEADSDIITATAKEYLDWRYAEEGPWGEHDPPDTFPIAARLKDLGVSEAKALDMMLAYVGEHERQWLTTLVAHAYKYGENEPGCDRPMAGSEVFGEAAAKLPKLGDWPEPVDIFGDILTPEPKLTRDMLPAVIAEFAFDAALGYGVEPAGVAIPCLAACAGAIHDGVRIQTREHDTNWTERACLWVANVSPSGSNKTAAQAAAIAPLREIEKEWRIQDEAKFLAYDALFEGYKQRLRDYKSTAQAIGSQSATVEPPPFPAEPPRPPRGRTIATDFTMEALREILVDNDRGITLVFDELTAFVGSFGTYNAGGGMKDRALALELHNGGYQPADRKKGSTVCHNWSASIIGSIQPAKLAAVAAKNSLSDDGLLQRFWLYNAEPTGPGIDRAPNIAARDRYKAVVRALARIERTDNCGHPLVLRLAPDAREYWQEIEALSYALSQEQRLPSACREHMGRCAAYTRGCC